MHAEGNPQLDAHHEQNGRNARFTGDHTNSTRRRNDLYNRLNQQYGWNTHTADFIKDEKKCPELPTPSRIAPFDGTGKT